ncbi:MAG: hypothetical protein GF388_06045 [Candidatus Aegiribacteria sp.]|nr:hypothetical protein [Candidatus Aegiribacteria sp.]MBD3294734.1 hypothetical protein [Candidatus Fermentibacteria bacterium]
MAGILSSGLNCTWNLAMAPERIEEWSDEKKRDEIRRLEEAREHDAEAIVEMGKALEIMQSKG